MYVGRGAYCGLVVDKDGYAINAMSTIRWSINDATLDVGNRWSPPVNSDVFIAQQKGKGALWGMITPPGKTSVDAADDMKQLGMRFFPKNNKNDYGAPGTEVVVYTHGMIRSIYETVRIGQGTAFEMSIGTDTFKLSSCLSCSSFMMANGVDASSSHLGRGESWSPYFENYTPDSHNYSYVKDEETAPLKTAIKKCNKAYAECMHQWLTDGVAAMEASPTWVDEKHKPALKALSAKLVKEAKNDNTVARDLYLDAMTFHKGDSKRLQDTLVYDTRTAKSPCDGKFDWRENKQTDGDQVKGIWETFENPLTDEQVAALHAAPMQLGANKQKMLTPATTLPIKSESETGMLNGEVHVGLVIGLSTHQRPSALVIPDIQGAIDGTSPVYLAKPLSLELGDLANFIQKKTSTDLKTVGAEGGKPGPLERFLKNTSVSVNAFYFRKGKKDATKPIPPLMLMQFALNFDAGKEGKGGLIKSLTGDEDLGNLFDIKGVSLRVLQCDAKKDPNAKATLQSYMDGLSDVALDEKGEVAALTENG